MCPASTSPEAGTPPSKAEMPSKPSQHRTRNKNPVTSLKIFRQFILRRPDGTLDASEINSKECFNAWMAARKTGSCRRPERFFQRTLTSHISGTDGRTPFTEEEESAILTWLRIKQRWPCFDKSEVRFGEQGFRGKGFHEKLAEKSGGTSSTELVERDDESLGDVSEEEESDVAKPLPKSNVSKRLKVLTRGDSDGDETMVASLPTPNTSNRSFDATRPLIPMHIPDAHYAQVLAETFTAESHLFKQEPHALFRTTLVGLYNMFTSLQDVTITWWRNTLTWLRMRCLGRGWLPPTMEDAQAVVEDFTQRFPGHYVHVFDFTAPRMEDRIMLQNEESRRLFGRISRQEGGFTGKRFLPRDAWPVFRAIARAFSYPDTEIPTQLRWVLTGQGGLRTAMFTTSYVVNDDVRLVIEHGLMVEGTLTS